MFAHRSAVRHTAVRVTSPVEEGCDMDKVPEEHEHVIVGVDTHADLHVAVVLSALVSCWASRRSPRPGPVTPGWSSGPPRSGRSTGSGSRAPAVGAVA